MVEKAERQGNTYVKEIQTQVNGKHMQTIEAAMIEAKGREKWRASIPDPKLISI